MITSAIKITGLFIIFLFVMSISVMDKPLFMHAYKVISPITKYVQTTTENFVARSFSGTQSYTKKIFDNSVPKMKDSVKSKMSSSNKGAPAERITEKEKEELNQLIRNH
jgi:hypothetical protein